MNAIFRHGKPTMIDHTPASAVAAGAILVVGALLLIAHSDIAANVKGDVAVGDGVYEVVKHAGDSVEFAVGEDVYWDAAESEATDVALGNKRIGICVAAAVEADTTVWVLHIPAGSKVACGQHTTIDADDTVITGLALVHSVVASLDDDPVDGVMHVTATKGDQAGAPAAGSIQIKSWKSTDGDATLIAGTTFTKKVNWIAIGA